MLHSPGTFGVATGEIRFSITPVPEPASAGLMALGAIRSRRRLSRGRVEYIPWEFGNLPCNASS
ncbi:MAG: hypothetical protein DCC65_17510 [Planctomycetota bacterium]|nr:MAG: hypothetical protein DCC65_17510 [Planctomycetota bacterium]